MFLFYQNLGKLFYAVAAIDNVVRDEELETLKKLVKQYWLSQDIITDKSIRNMDNVIVNTFIWLCKDNQYSAEECYNSFIRFKKQNNALFSSKIKSLILKTAGKVAASFSNQNKSELMLLAKLNIEFKKQNNDN
ncbi:hypothetical protein [Psychroserpens sp.]|uniref:hypothetical protein n=1 Tax=Psychroserpens sp. TaxID=2020870 RepID=UPI002B2795A9|nr:hypothetical protein [Psychroserpens sp.]